MTSKIIFYCVGSFYVVITISDMLFKFPWATARTAYALQISFFQRLLHNDSSWTNFDLSWYCPCCNEDAEMSCEEENYFSKIAPRTTWISSAPWFNKLLTHLHYEDLSINCCQQKLDEHYKTSVILPLLEINFWKKEQTGHDGNSQN